MRRVMEISTPLGEDVLLFHCMSAREELSRLSEFSIDLLSERRDINLDEIMGKNVTVKLELPDDQVRFFNGYVTRFAQGRSHGRYYTYHTIVRPWLWFLTRTSDCRIFQEMTVPDIIKKVFDEHSVADVTFELSGNYRVWEYCVQYRETDFNFASRLMEQEGIYYYFKHQDGRHTLIIADSYTVHSAVEGYQQIPFILTDRFARSEQEHIDDWNFAREIQPGRYVLDDFNFKTPSLDLQTHTKITHKHELADYEMFDYPGIYTVIDEGEHYVKTRLEEIHAQYECAYAKSNARGITVGSLFKLTGHTRTDQNREYLTIKASYDLKYTEYEAMEEGGGSTYSCGFTAMNSSQPFRPQRTTPKPFVQGPQTAIVVGKAGEEIWTDEYGRVKLQFHWDRDGKKDQNASCWVRVAQVWAGKNWGWMTVPRIGQEVIVDFLEGDPDRPIITGRVYNAEQMPPWALPANKTQSGILTRSSPGGSAANANELRFEDKKGSEQVYLHAEKNQNIEVENDETHWVGHDRSKTIDHDETSHIKHDRTETVDNNETITIGVNRTEQVGANESITIGSNRTKSVGASETVSVALQRTHAVGINETIAIGAAQEVAIGAFQVVAIGAYQTVNVGGYQSVNVGVNQTTTVGTAQSVTVGTNQSINVGGNQNESVSGNASKSVKGNDALSVDGNRGANIKGDDSAKVGKNLVIDAGDSVTIKTGSASISMKKDGTIVIKGKDITVEGSGKINVKASSNIVMKGSKILQN